MKIVWAEPDGVTVRDVYEELRARRGDRLHHGDDQHEDARAEGLPEDQPAGSRVSSTSRRSRKHKVIRRWCASSSIACSTARPAARRPPARGRALERSRPARDRPADGERSDDDNAVAARPRIVRAAARGDRRRRCGGLAAAPRAPRGARSPTGGCCCSRVCCCRSRNRGRRRAPPPIVAGTPAPMSIAGDVDRAAMRRRPLRRPDRAWPVSELLLAYWPPASPCAACGWCSARSACAGSAARREPIDAAAARHRRRRGRGSVCAPASVCRIAWPVRSPSASGTGRAPAAERAVDGAARAGGDRLPRADSRPAPRLAATSSPKKSSARCSGSIRRSGG